MAASAPAADTPKPKGPSMVIQLGMLVGLTVLAVGIGWFAGGHLRGEVSTSEAPAAADHAAPAADAHGGGHGEAEEDGAPRSSTNPKVIDIAPITTTLSSPAETWVRMEMSVYFREAPPEGVVEKIEEDVIGYMRTVKLHQIEGPSGFQHFKSDLEERANMLSAGRVEAILIRTLLFE